MQARPHPDTDPADPEPAAALHAPPDALAACVRAFFWRDLTACAGGALPDTRVPPSPYPGIVWQLRGTSELLECAGQPAPAPMPLIALSGAHRHPYHSRSSSNGHSFCVALQPGALGLLTGQDVSPLTDRVVDASAWLPADWAPWLAAMGAATSHRARIALAVDFLAPRWTAVAQPLGAWLRLLPHAWQRSARESVAAELGWTPRHLQRRTRQLAGLRPGEIERMLRAEHALLAMRDADAGALDAALGQGYADQAHFSREARALYQRPPAALKHHVLQPQDDADWLLRRSPPVPRASGE